MHNCTWILTLHISIFCVFHNKRTFVLWFLAIYLTFYLKVGDILSLKYYYKFIYFNRSLSAVVEYSDRSLGYIPSLQIYCREANLPALLSNYQQVTVPKGVIVAKGVDPGGDGGDTSPLIFELGGTNI